MSSFTEARFEPTGAKRAGRKLYRVSGGFDFYIGYPGSGLAVRVPDGFVTDGPSIPWLVRWAIPTKRMVKASAVHDMLREDRRFTKLEGDAIFLTAMQVERTPFVLRELAFLAVRANGSRSFDRPQNT